MQAASFRKWLEPLAQLSRRQREQLLERLRLAVGSRPATDRIGSAESMLRIALGGASHNER